METAHKKVLKSISLELRHLLEGSYDASGHWHPGDLEQRLAAIGVRRDREPVPVDELPHLAPADRKARQVVDAYLQLRAGVVERNSFRSSSDRSSSDRSSSDRSSSDPAPPPPNGATARCTNGMNSVLRQEAVAEFVRETAYTWANRLLALRCMEARELIDEVILQKPTYGGRSLEHHRLAQRQPEACAGEDDGLLAVLDKVFAEQAQHLPMLFDPAAPGVALKPSASAIKRCMALLSNSQRVGDDEVPTAVVFKAPDAFGWAYQYWNTEEKDRVFEKVRTEKGAKIEGADIIPATQLYTEPYMVKFLVQNSLGATWMGMYPDSKLCEKWEYYVHDADRVVERNSFRSCPLASPATAGEERNEFRSTTKPVAEITFLDPACGSGHFLLEAFDLFYDMYVEEGQLREPQAICRSILENNLFGIDIDARAVQIAEVAVWMKAAERAFGFEGKPTNLVAAVASHLKGPLWNQFLSGFEREPSVARVLRRFGQAMEHIDQLGSLARPNEELRAIIHEEHATWERQVAEKQEANFLFPEMAEDKLRGQLPFHEISDGEFGERMLYRARTAIHAFTEQSRQAGTFQDQFLGYEATAGFKLLDLLGRKYDVVAANPPYMGSKNLGPVVKRHIERCYKLGKRDVYAAFLLRSRDLLRPKGALAMVTQQAWLFISSFEQLRRLILERDAIRLLSHHGRYAFSEITNAVVQPVLYVAQVNCLTEGGVVTAFRFISPLASEEQALILKNAVRNPRGPSCHRSRQDSFAKVPGNVLCYWVPPKLLGLLQSSSVLGQYVSVHKGLDTADNLRFVRCFWEVPWRGRRWRLFPKGGGYRKWCGFNHFLVDWELSGRRIKANGRGTPRNEHSYGMGGLTYTEFGRGCLGVRILPTDAIFSTSSPGIMFQSNLAPRVTQTLLNCRVASYFLRVLQANMQHLGEGYLPLVPVPAHPPVHSDCVASAAIVIKTEIISRSPCESEFLPCNTQRADNSDVSFVTYFGEQAILHTLEGILERIVFDAYDINGEDRQAILQETGVPTGWLTILEGYDVVPVTPRSPSSSGFDVGRLLAPLERVRVTSEQLNSLMQNLRLLYDKGFGAALDDDDEGNPIEDDGGEESVAFGASMPIPPETFLEELCQRLCLHPLTVYWLLKEGIEQHGWRCLPEEQRLVRDRLSVVILQLLGYRWPRQIEGGETVPKWADRDGIIPLTEAVGESTMFDRVVERNSFRSSGAADAAGTGVNSVNVGNGMNSVLREFADLMGKPLDQWLTMDFFKHHTSQFKKRPIAWQIQSSKFTARTKPAFACVVYYHKLDGDLMEKIRTQYVGPLRQRWETELRGIESVAPAARSDRQTLRRTELGDLIKDVQGFNAALHSVQESGFGTAELRLFARQDALLCMKARWLRRLSETIEAAPLAAWTTAAQAAAIHEDLPDWIDSAFVHLEHHCHRIGLSDWSSPDDPAPPSLAALICQDPASLAGSAVECANRNWWSRLDEVVLSPLRREISEKKETLKAVQAELKELAKDEHDRRAELREREHDLKWEIKSIKAKLDGIIGRADSLRTTIAAWECREATTWESWLASQPMYDAISSVDGRRRPPTTVPDWIAQEQSYVPDINDGVRVNIAPLQKAGLLAADVLAKKDLDKAIAGRAEWRADERRWCREGRLPQPGWWPS